jgi:hypothetical protein
MMDDMIFREGHVDNRLLEQLATVSSRDESIHRREQLGGMLNFYYREAAYKRGSCFCTIRAGKEQDYRQPVGMRK